MKVLIVDDDLDLIAITAFALEQAGYLVVRATDGDKAIEAVRDESPDIVVLDINLPRRNGFELTAHIRERGATPVIMLTARSDEEDVVRALGLGADDYLTKPFSPKVLVARVRALLRRAGTDVDNEIRAGCLTLRPDDLTLEGLPGGPFALTPLEARLMHLLLVQAGRTVPTERILTHVWGGRAGGNRQLLKQLVHRLRQKLEADPAAPKFLRTVPNAGYVLDAANVESA
jgi:DNA-binding response OmpR family regulator